MVWTAGRPASLPARAVNARWRAGCRAWQDTWAPVGSPIAACYDNLSSTFDYLESR